MSAEKEKGMKKKVCLLLAVICCAAVSAVAFAACNDNEGKSGGNVGGATQGLVFEKVDDGYAVTGYNGIASDIVIPESYEGEPVTEIGKRAFEGNERIKSVVIPDSVKTIGACSFDGCMALESVTIPDSVTNIESDAFYVCPSLTAVHITDISKWAAIDFEYGGANPLYTDATLYCNGKAVQGDITLSGITRIGDGAFYGCDRITSVTIGRGVTQIGSSAFNGCTSLGSVTYLSTKANWAKVNIKSSSWNDGCPFDVVKCTDGNVLV